MGKVKEATINAVAVSKCEDISKRYFLNIYRKLTKTCHTLVDFGPILEKLYNKKFIDIYNLDCNRIAHCITAKEYFLDETKHDASDYCELMTRDCSVLEILYLLSCDMFDNIVDHDADNSTTISCLFYKMLDNLGLTSYRDSVSISENRIEEILDKFINRTYSRTGRGGLFPLKHSRKDQRQVELWYQMMEYLNENYRLYD